MKTQKDYIALLTIPEMPTIKRDKNRLLKWLREVTYEIHTEDPKIFAKPCRFRLMK